ncbi:CidA/LrgA family protein [Rhizobium daejeonense]|uniref:CidA/LrgA family protein n=1 Tax=Rhizobium daejeonense TaxID=240521 RepID=A0A6M1SAV4_9HYPH|nr:CidA/LrgA family protein [Rhizobium daejeonense]NGO66617.1 CidA/LrgA family protein [Rhizobium daejeonense]
MRTIVHRVAGLVVILAAWGVGDHAATALHLPVPGSIAGLAVLFFGFVTIPRLLAVVTPAGQTLLRHFPLFLYPLGAGFLTLKGLGPMVLLKMLAAIAVSLVLSLVLGAYVFRSFKRARG